MNHLRNTLIVAVILASLLLATLNPFWQNDTMEYVRQEIYLDDRFKGIFSTYSD